MQASYQTFVESGIHLVSFLMLGQLDSAFHWLANQIRIIHLELLKHLFSIAFLGDQEAFVFLIFFNAKVVRHEPNVDHLELLRHLFLKFIEHAWIATYEDQVIYIQAHNQNITILDFDVAHNQNITILDFDVERMLIWTLDEISFLEVLVNSSIPSS